MVLIINCIPKLEDRDWFTRAVVPRLEDPVHIEAGRRLFENFFAASSIAAQDS